MKKKYDVIEDHAGRELYAYGVTIRRGLSFNEAHQLINHYKRLLPKRSFYTLRTIINPTNHV